MVNATRPAGTATDSHLPVGLETPHGAVADTADSATSGLAVAKRPRRRWRGVLLTIAGTLLVFYLVVWWTALRIVEHPSWPPPADAVTPDQAQETTEEFARRSDPQRDDVAIPFAPATASSVEFFRGGPAFFPAMLNDIESASQSIHLMMFGITEGEIAQSFVDALIERANAGIEVRLSVDAYGAKVDSQSEPYFKAMAAAGIQIVVNNVFPPVRNGLYGEQTIAIGLDQVGQADHRKLMVIDGAAGWVGGAGLQDHFNGGRFHDVFVRVEGDIVRQMQAVFLTSFHAYGGPLSGEPGSLAPYFPVPAHPGTIRTTLLQNIPGGFLPATQASRATIKVATGRLDILNPYLTDPGMLDLIVAAAERGVDVRIVVPGISNNVPADSALRHVYPRLLDAGIEIWEYPTVMHAKVTVTGDTVIAGTINYDAWALYRNLEMALMFEGEALADQVAADMIDLDVEISRPGEQPDGLVFRVRAWVWDKLVYFL